MKVNNNDVRLEANKKVFTKRIVAKNANGLTLEDDDGNYIKINDGGIVDISKSSGGAAYKDNAQSIAKDTYTKINIDHLEWDLQDEFDSGDNRFTVKESGYYLVMANAYISSLVDPDPMYSNIRKNGASKAYIIWPMGRSGSPAYNISDIVQLDANDYIEIWVRHGYLDVRNTGDSIQQCFLSFYKLS